MRSRNRQQVPRVGHAAVFASGASYQARGWEKSPKWFLKGLERFINADDSEKDYVALKQSFPSFWPLPLQSGDRKDLSWAPEAHKLFLFYRDLLRRFWTRDHRTLKDGFQSELLFGTVPFSRWEPILDGTSCNGFDMPLLDALAPLRSVSANLTFLSNPFFPLASFAAEWNAGVIDYNSQLDFQRAVWHLFRQSWRAKVCPKCSTYLLVGKPAQLYCSLNCSGAAHRASALTWWKQKGSKNRARARVKRAERKNQ
jgi:hypothetical protein